MKTIRVTFRKAEASAVCTLTYRITDFHQSAVWSGAKDAFLTDGRLPLVGGHLANLDRLLAHQAALSGFTFTIEDLGGQAMDLRFEALPPFSES